MRIDWVIDWVTGWIDWVIDWVTDWLVHAPISRIVVAAVVIVVEIWLLVRSFVLFNGVSSVVAIIISLGE